MARRAPGALGITRSNMATLTLTCSGRWPCLQPQPFVRPEDLGFKTDFRLQWQECYRKFRPKEVLSASRKWVWSGAEASSSLVL